MSKSLQEQLLQSGAARPKQAKKARRDKTRRQRQARREGAADSDEQQLAREIDLAQAAKKRADRQRNAARNAEREARERDRAAAGIIAHNRLAAGGDDAVAFNYSVDGRIKRIAVDDAQRRNLAAGRLAIVHHEGAAVLVTAAVARRLRALLPERIWQAPADPDTSDPDDPYADFPVPDDIRW